MPTRRLTLSLHGLSLKILLCLLALSGLAASAQSAKPSAAIKVDQVGYLPSAAKLASVAADAKSFEVIDLKSNKSVLSGKLSSPVADSSSGDSVRYADFSALKTPGDYVLNVPGLGRSWKFKIADDVYNPAYRIAMRAFYGQRCGMAVDMGPDFPGFKHAACHLKSDFHPSSGRSGERDNIGGWHDAGDYGRYTVNASVSNGLLLQAWSLYGDKLKSIGLAIPESGQTTPDFLSEVRYNLEWTLKMQDEDGGAWHKQTALHFGGFMPPEQDTDEPFIVGSGAAPFKTTCGTADLAASAAAAARIFAPYDKAFADRALAAARKGWAWVRQNPNAYFTNVPGVQSGNYPDNRCTDEILWASAELYQTTGEDQFNQYFTTHYEEFLPELAKLDAENWRVVSPMALWAYAAAPRSGANPRVVAAIRERSVLEAKRIASQTEQRGYRVSVAGDEYHWGSNDVAAGYGVELMLANRFSPDPKLAAAALDNLHYLLGNNTFSLSFVSQLGENALKHPHHRPSGSQKYPGAWPGLLSGGPNSYELDPALKVLHDKNPNLPPAKSFVDSEGSWCSNEIAINWQAVFVYLLAGQVK